MVITLINMVRYEKESLPNNFSLVICDGPPGTTKRGEILLLIPAIGIAHFT